MRKLLLLGVILFSAAVGTITAKLRSRLARVAHPALCSDVACDHFNVRMAAIESVIAQKGAEPSYLAIGDSFVELADLPNLCGHRPINAGIGGATVETFETNARRLAELAKPDFVVVEIGTNDALRNKGSEFQAKLSKLLSSLAPWPVIVVPLPPGPRVADAARLNQMISVINATKAAPLAHVETLPDGIHLTAASYVEWKKSIADAAQNSVCN